MYGHAIHEIRDSRESSSLFYRLLRGYFTRLFSVISFSFALRGIYETSQDYDSCNWRRNFEFWYNQTDSSVKSSLHCWYNYYRTVYWIIRFNLLHHLLRLIVIVTFFYLYNITINTRIVSITISYMRSVSVLNDQTLSVYFTTRNKKKKLYKSRCASALRKSYNANRNLKVTDRRSHCSASEIARSYTVELLSIGNDKSQKNWFETRTDTEDSRRIQWSEAN